MSWPNMQTWTIPVTLPWHDPNILTWQNTSRSNMKTWPKQTWTTECMESRHSTGQIQASLQNRLTSSHLRPHIWPPCLMSTTYQAWRSCSFSPRNESRGHPSPHTQIHGQVISHMMVLPQNMFTSWTKFHKLQPASPWTSVCHRNGTPTHRRLAWV